MAPPQVTTSFQIPGRIGLKVCFKKSDLYACDYITTKYAGWAGLQRSFGQIAWQYLGLNDKIMCKRVQFFYNKLYIKAYAILNNFYY